MGFITDFIATLVEQALELWTTLFLTIGENVFYIEKTISKVLTVDNMDKLFQYSQGIAFSYLAIKVLQKGFFTYILWRDGDPDAPITATLQNIVLAIVASVGFTTLYDYFAEIFLWMLKNYTTFLFEAIEIDVFTGIVVVQLASSGIIGILLLIYVIMLFTLYLQFLKRGAELLILRLGFPLACVGMIDSDKGVLTPMIKSFIQVAFTTIVQLFFVALSMVIFVNGGEGIQVSHIFVGIGCCMAAFNTPNTLNFILLQVQGGAGNAVQKVGGVAHTATAVKNLIGK